MPYAAVELNAMQNLFLTRSGVEMHLALYDGDPLAAGTEITGGGYARVQVTQATFDTVANGDTQNTAAINFPTATGDWNSGNPIYHYAIMSAASGGIVRVGEALTTSRTVLNGDPVSFGAGDLDLIIN